VSQVTGSTWSPMASSRSRTGRRARRAPGTSSAKIALLLRDVPRTATVKATTVSHLYALEREDFLAAVTGHSAVHAAGEAVVEERLNRS